LGGVTAFGEGPNFWGILNREASRRDLWRGLGGTRRSKRGSDDYRGKMRILKVGPKKNFRAEDAVFEEGKKRSANRQRGSSPDQTSIRRKEKGEGQKLKKLKGGAQLPFSETTFSGGGRPFPIRGKCNLLCSRKDRGFAAHNELSIKEGETCKKKTASTAETQSGEGTGGTKNHNA